MSALFASGQPALTIPRPNIKDRSFLVSRDVKLKFVFDDLDTLARLHVDAAAPARSDLLKE